MLDFIRVAAAVPEVSVGNVEENVKRIIEKAEDAEKDKPQLLVFLKHSKTSPVSINKKPASPNLDSVTKIGDKNAQRKLFCIHKSTDASV